MKAMVWRLVAAGFGVGLFVAGLVQGWLPALFSGLGVGVLLIALFLDDGSN